jgi:hypothetical protein
MLILMLILVLEVINFLIIFQTLSKNPNSRQSVSLSFSVPIFKWGINKNNLRISENNYKKNFATLKNNEIEFNNDLEEKISAYNSAINLFFYQKRNMKFIKSTMN